MRGDMARVPLRSLIRVFAWTGLIALGGGRSAYFYDAVVVRRAWVTTGEFVQDLTLSQLLPGPNFANLAVALGCRLGGWRGGVWALLAVLVPGALALLGLTVLYVRGAFAPRATRFMQGWARRWSASCSLRPRSSSPRRSAAGS